MTTTNKVPAPSSAAELVSILHLDDIRPVSLSASMHWEGRDESKTATTLGISEHHGDKTLLVTMTASHKGSLGDFEVAYTARYDAPHEVQFLEEPVREFVEKVAAMALIPYLRAGLADVTGHFRVGAQTIPMIRAGEFQVSPPDQE